MVILFKSDKTLSASDFKIIKLTAEELTSWKNKEEFYTLLFNRLKTNIKNSIMEQLKKCNLGTATHLIVLSLDMGMSNGFQDGKT